MRFCCLCSILILGCVFGTIGQNSDEFKDFKIDTRLLKILGENLNERLKLLDIKDSQKSLKKHSHSQDAKGENLQNVTSANPKTADSTDENLKETFEKHIRHRNNNIIVSANDESDVETLLADPDVENEDLDFGDHRPAFDNKDGFQLDRVANDKSNDQIKIVNDDMEQLSNDERKNDNKGGVVIANNGDDRKHDGDNGETVIENNGAKEKSDRRDNEGNNQNKEAVYGQAAVVCDYALCSDLGKYILKQNGSAVDSAIATSLCLGVINMFATGIGGGGFMLVYIRETGMFEALDFRERSPGAYYETMFDNKVNMSRHGGKSIGVPGLVRGLYKAWKRYGRLPWSELVEPAITLALDGFDVGEKLETVIKKKEEQILQDQGLRDLFLKSSEKGKGAGSKIKNKELATTLRAIKDDPESFYTGVLARKIVKDVQSIGGNITLEDLKNYTVRVRDVVSTSMKEMGLYTVGLPSGGPSVIQIINTLKTFNLSAYDLDPVNRDRQALTYHRIIEAFKFAYAQRTKYGDPSFADDPRLLYKITKEGTSQAFADSIAARISDTSTFDYDYYGAEYLVPYSEGTSHTSVLAPNGDAVSCTTSINEWLGALYRSTDTGIIYNNVMSDFSVRSDALEYGLLPPSKENRVKGGKTPLSAISPVIITDPLTQDVKMVIGGTGGSRIITAVAMTIMYKFWFGGSLSASVLAPRLYHQLMPNEVVVETDMSIDPNVISKLQALGHRFELIKALLTSTQAIYVPEKGRVEAMSDIRRDGGTSGY